MAFKPLNDDHAIETVRFSALVSGALRPSIYGALEKLHVSVRDQLPALSRGSVDLDIGVGQTVAAPSISFSFLRPDGTPNWNVQVFGNRISVDCNFYTRWERVWFSARDYITLILESISKMQPDLRLTELEFMVADVFLVDDDQYNLKELIEDVGYFAPKIFNCGSLWHCNTGWFENNGSGNRVLHNLNCESIGHDSGFAVRIAHFQKREFSQESQKKISTVNTSDIEVPMNALHDSNKQLLRQLLNADMVRRIGLEAEK